MPEHESNLLNTGRPMTMTNASAENTISIVQNGSVGTAVATDGAIHINNTGNTGIGLGIYSDIDGTADASLVILKADNALFDKNILEIINDGVSSAVNVTHNGTLATNEFAIKFTWNGNNTNACGAALFYSNYAHTVSTPERAIVQIHNDNASSVAGCLYVSQDGAQDAINIRSSNTGKGLAVNQDGAGQCIYCDHDDTGANPSIEIDRDGNNVARIFGIKITVDNADVGGLVGGIDFSAMADGEPLFKLVSTDTDLSAKSPETDAEAGFFPVLVGTTTYAVPFYSLA